jgi:hypothetical protein
VPGYKHRTYFLICQGCWAEPAEVNSFPKKDSTPEHNFTIEILFKSLYTQNKN